MTPTLRLSQFLTKENLVTLNPNNNHSPMNQPTSFIVWNISGINNDKFRRNFKEIIRNHNPNMIALLETKMSDHLSLKNEFGFDDYLEIPAHERSGGIVLLWLANWLPLPTSVN
ncbi:hypothetical protein HAX54_003897 [Datura stramonium]|uniref:Uncharacterized protein n=1 Tax=Datura stramonium TaxID=4076 RepID=A0ABS8T8D8_DATST|nr:hypothetical protein [Datura stramonium]